MPTQQQIHDLLGKDADPLLTYKARGLGKQFLHLPGLDFLDCMLFNSDRPIRVPCNFLMLLNHGRLAGAGNLSILPVGQSVEHSAGAHFASIPAYFDGVSIVRLAIKGGCNAIASSLGVLATVSRRYAHKMPSS
jgi:class I fructose-bisphosphate aldolase